MVCSIITDMMKLIALLSSYIVLWLRLLSPGGVRAIAAENIALRQQLITLSRRKKRTPRLTFFDKITLGILTTMISAKRLARIAIILKPATFWVIVVPDQFTRCIVGFSTHKGSVTGIDLCCMFNKIINRRDPPNYLSSDNDQLFHFHLWKAHLRILDIEEIKSVPYAPTSHPFIERLIGTIRREILDKTFYWHANDLQNKLELFQCYYNEERCHGSIDGLSPLQKADEKSSTVVSIHDYRWKKYCRGLFQLPIAA